VGRADVSNLAGGGEGGMSGICAAVGQASTCQGMLAAMAAGLRLDPAERLESVSDGAAGVAIARRFDSQQIHDNGRILVACDAEFYNEEELWGGIAGQGGPAQTGGSAPLIAALYERFGAGFVKRLRGRFSFVLWDRLRRRLVAAIDAFGMNRLVWFANGETLLVATRVDALMASGAIGRQVNPRAIANVLNFSCNLGPDTIFAGVQRLLPGTMLVGAGGRTRVETWWDIDYFAGGGADESLLAAEMEAVVEQAVASHSRDRDSRPLGAFLSGGTDSSTVVGMMVRTGGRPVKAFSIGFEEQPFNELGYAEIAARGFGAEHHIHLVGARECFDSIPDMVRAFDEPYANSSAIPTYFCAKLAAENGVRVLLAGDGGDELFGGNERYATDKIFEAYTRVPGVLRKGLIEPVLAALPFENGLTGRARRYVARANMPGIERMLSFQFLFTHAAETIFEGDFLKTLGGYSAGEIPSRYYAQAHARDHLDRLLYFDVKMTLGDCDLPKVTCMAELAGVQVRFPLLDLAVAEFSGRVPARLKVKGFEKRYLFKRAFRNLLPPEIIRKKKHGFGIPVAMWMKSDPLMRELARDTLLSSRAFGRGYFRRGFIEELFQRHESDDTCYYGDTLWSFLALELWHRQSMDQPLGAAV
jgi:asparagine synthase (glutamine-hydrolysing)